jgi:hypothetical protein
LTIDDFGFPYLAPPEALYVQPPTIDDGFGGHLTLDDWGLPTLAPPEHPYMQPPTLDEGFGGALGADDFGYAYLAPPEALFIQPPTLDDGYGGHLTVDDWGISTLAPPEALFIQPPRVDETFAGALTIDDYGYPVLPPVLFEAYLIPPPQDEFIQSVVALDDSSRQAPLPPPDIYQALVPVDEGFQTYRMPDDWGPAALTFVEQTAWLAPVVEAEIVVPPPLVADEGGTNLFFPLEVWLPFYAPPDFPIQPIPPPPVPPRRRANPPPVPEGATAGPRFAAVPFPLFLKPRELDDEVLRALRAGRRVKVAESAKVIAEPAKILVEPANTAPDKAVAATPATPDKTDSTVYSPVEPVSRHVESAKAYAGPSVTIRPTPPDKAKLPDEPTTLGAPAPTPPGQGAPAKTGLIITGLIGIAGVAAWAFSRQSEARPRARKATPALRPAVTASSFQQKWIRCGNPRCRACPHGPYWYEYWEEDGVTKWRYHGKRRKT